MRSILLVILLFLIACDSGKNKDIQIDAPAFGSYNMLPRNDQRLGSGKYRLRMHNSRCLREDIEAIYVEILEVQLITPEKEVVTAMNRPTRVDLMNFTDDISVDVLNEYAPTGTYCKINFVFGENNSIVVDGVEKELYIPRIGHWKNGFKLKPKESFEIVEDHVFSMKIDFDLDHSIVFHRHFYFQDRNDCFYLLPKIRITEIDSVAISSYNMETEINGETIVVQFSTDGTIQYLSSENTQYIFNGYYDYDSETDMIYVSFNSGAIIDPDCLECGILGSGGIDEFNVNIPFNEFQVIDYTNNELVLLWVDTGETITFTSRNTFGPFADY